jgi:hypothetical protein
VAGEHCPHSYGILVARLTKGSEWVERVRYTGTQRNVTGRPPSGVSCVLAWWADRHTAAPFRAGCIPTSTSNPLGSAAKVPYTPSL